MTPIAREALWSAATWRRFSESNHEWTRTGKEQKTTDYESSENYEI